MRKTKKILKVVMLTFTTLILIIVIALTIISLNAYKPLDEMYDAIEVLDTDSIEINESFDSYRLTVANPIAKIVMIPGGLVYTESYLFMAYILALEGYDVTVSKALFHLSILTPNYASKFLSKDLPNIIIGHSLGGTVGGMITKNNKSINHLILLASYTTSSITDAQVLLITAQNDFVINKVAYDNALDNYNSYEQFEIEGGNHAGFGWYGKQSGDGEAIITIYEQQLQVLDIILLYLEKK